MQLLPAVTSLSLRPANIRLNPAADLTINLRPDDIGDFNTDPVADKSVSIIRNMNGKGPLIRGARTLAGNSSEWRYISIRRLCTMIEDDINKAVKTFVLESNDASTWAKLRTIIVNYLSTLWRSGTLQGSKQEEAFYVSIGLGKTMTPADVLEGRILGEIGIAIVRPAEFILFRFSHMTIPS